MFFFSEDIRKRTNKDLIIARNFVLYKGLVGQRIIVKDTFKKYSFIVKEFMLGFKAGFFSLVKDRALKKGYAQGGKGRSKRKGGRERDKKSGKRVRRFFGFGLFRDKAYKRRMRAKFKRKRIKAMRGNKGYSRSARKRPF